MPSARSWVIAALLVTLVGCAFTLRFEASGDARHALSADERSYLRLAEDLRHTGTYGDPGLADPFHWAPGTPAVFEAAAALGDGHRLADRHGEGPARTAQAVAGTLTVVAVFALAALLAGPWAGLAAAAAAAFYPPAITLSETFLSEPLGALGLVLAMLALAWAWRAPPRGSRWRATGRFALAGAVFGLACLVRADLLASLLLVPVAVALLRLRADGARRALAHGAVMLAAGLLVIAPWCAYASSRERRLVPITSGGGSTLYAATYLPGNGTIFGMKRALAAQTCSVHRYLCGRSSDSYQAEYTFDGVAAAHPFEPRDSALQQAALHNLRDDVLHHTGAFASMMSGKLWRMWGSYFIGRHRTVDRTTLWIHRSLVGLALLGLLAGLVVSRNGLLGASLLVLLIETAVNVLFVAEPRHNTRLLPVLLAAGAAGWTVLLRSARARLRRASPPAARSAA